MVPSLPLNGAGKIDRGMAQARLRDAFAARAAKRVGE
jgi:hypothetical protein